MSISGEASTISDCICYFYTVIFIAVHV
jgi:hypothetical protein